MTAGLGARRSALGVLLAAAAIPARAQSDTLWRQHDAAADSARAHGDWKEYKRYAELLYKELNGHPGTVLALARAGAQLGDTAGAMRWLRIYAGTGLVRDMDADSVLAPVRGAPGWRELLARMAKNREAVHHATVAFTIPDSLFVAEDITYDSATKQFFVSSVREGKVVAVKKGQVKDFATDPCRRAMMAVAADPARSAFWATAAALPESGSGTSCRDGATAVLRFHLATRALKKRYTAAPDSGNDVYGDMVVARNGDVFVSNSTGGQLYVIRAGRDTLATLVPAGTFGSPQEPAVAPDGRRVFLADYIRGIAIVDRKTGAVSWLANDAHAALSGIDGLTMASHALIAVQNGVNPNRVIRLELDRAMTHVVGWSTLEANTPQLREPNHGVLLGDKFYFIATSGWDRFGPDGKVTAGAALERPVVMVVDVR